MTNATTIRRRLAMHHLRDVLAGCSNWKGNTMRKILLCALLLLLTACGHDFAGQTYRVEGGRQVSEVFGRGTTAWKASAEFRFGKCQSCHEDKYLLHLIVKELGAQ